MTANRWFRRSPPCKQCWEVGDSRCRPHHENRPHPEHTRGYGRQLDFHRQTKASHRIPKRTAATTGRKPSFYWIRSGAASSVKKITCVWSAGGMMPPYSKTLIRKSCSRCGGGTPIRAITFPPPVIPRTCKWKPCSGWILSSPRTAS